MKDLGHCQCSHHYSKHTTVYIPQDRKWYRRCLDKNCECMNFEVSEFITAVKRALKRERYKNKKELQRKNI